MIALEPKHFCDFNAAASREWLETNGIGGYASSTVSGAHSRRYHGLLVAATKPPLGRAVLLSKFEEAVLIDGERFELSSNLYPGVIYPRGYELITGFRLDPFPIWTYKVAGLKIEKKVFMISGENSTVIEWSVKEQAPENRKIELELRPLLAFRDHHQLRKDEAGFDTNLEFGDGFISFTPVADLPSLYLANNAASTDEAGHWYRNLEYGIELERGFDFSEDLYCPCVLAFDLSQPASVIASTDRRAIDAVKALENAERDRRNALVATAGFDDEFSQRLTLAADQFVVTRGEGKTVIAGYHWFSDWGRDTMIALNGLTIVTGRTDVAKSIITEFAKHISQGMIPNRFPDAGATPEYNTVDATLWFFEAIAAYAEKTGDYEFVRRELYDRLIDVIDWHERGTRYNIHLDTDGLLYAGEVGVQLTWMDAKIGDWVVTPRTGKAVELQALWYNALCIMAEFAKKFDDRENLARFTEMARIARESFNGQFWNDVDNCLYDVVHGDEKDASIRPNQIFAVSLRNSILDSERAREVVEKVETELLTPVGLRSLSPNDPRYVPAYIGSPLERDAAYHQGTVWAWLIGPFIDAYRKVHEADAETEARVREMLSGFEDHLYDTMVGQVS